MMGRNTGEPRYVPMVLVDKFCGHVLASAIGMALFSRERTGKGQEVIVPMLETMLSFNLVEHLWTNFFEGDRENLGYTRIFSPHRRPYATRDGHICMLAISDEQWRRVFAVIGRPELARDARFEKLQARTRNISELYGILAEEIETQDHRGVAEAARRGRSPQRRRERFPHHGRKSLSSKRPVSSTVTNILPKVRWSPPQFRFIRKHAGQHQARAASARRAHEKRAAGNRIQRRRHRGDRMNGLKGKAAM
jgi:crotonobetainyl-CoA:carnitine CoA-transferase CaiB-like acyl-CoA transferase